MTNQPTSTYRAIDNALWERPGCGLILCDKNGVIIRSNAQASLFFNLLATESLGKLSNSGVQRPEEERRRYMLQESFNRKDPWHIYSEGVKLYLLRAISFAETSDVLFELNKVSAFDEGKEAAGTSSKELFDGLSHDFNTPLNGIIGVASLMEEEFDHNVLLTEYAEIIKSRARTLEEVLAQVFGLLSGERPRIMEATEILELESFLEDLIQAMPELHPSRFKGTLVKDFPKEKVLLKSDQRYFSRALSHLLSGCLKHKPSSDIVIGYRIEKSPSEEEAFVRLKISCGIAELLAEIESWVKSEMHLSSENGMVEMFNYRRLMRSISLSRHNLEMLGFKSCLSISPSVGILLQIDCPLYSEHTLISKSE